MPTTQERLATLEAHATYHAATLDNVVTKLDELHAHFQQTKGAAASKHRFREHWQQVALLTTSVASAGAAIFMALVHGQPITR